MIKPRLLCRNPASLLQCRHSSSSSGNPPPKVPRSIPFHESRVRTMPGDFQVIDGEKGLFHNEIPFGNWRAASFVNYFNTVPYVPEGFNDKRTLKSEITGESYLVGTTDYAATRIAECGGLDAYLLSTPEKELDSQFAVELRRLIMQLVQCERVLEEPVTTEECLRQALKLEAVLGFKLATTDALVSDVLHDRQVEDDDTLLDDVEDDIGEDEPI